MTEGQPVPFKVVNEEVVKLRPLLKQAKVHAIHKITRKRKILLKRRGTEKRLQKNKLKADRFLREIFLIKKAKLDDVAIYALSEQPRKDVLRKSENDETVMARKLASHKTVQARVDAFRNSHPNWKSMVTSFAAKHNKRLSKKEKKEIINIVVENDETKDTPTRVNVPQSDEFSDRKSSSNNSLAETCLNYDNLDMFSAFSADSDSEIKTDESANQKGKNLNENKRTNLQVSVSEVDETRLTNSETSKLPEENKTNSRLKGFLKGKAKRHRKDVVVKVIKKPPRRTNLTNMALKQINLKDNDDFDYIDIPVKDEVDTLKLLQGTEQAQPKKAKDDFFAGVGDESSDEEGHKVDTVPSLPTAEGHKVDTVPSLPTAELSDRTHEGTGRKFATAAERYRKKLFPWKQKTFSSSAKRKLEQNSFHEVRTSRKAAVQSRPKSLGTKYKKGHTNEATFVGKKPSISKADELHPSWLASKRKKEMESRILPFEGKKVTFEDV